MRATSFRLVDGRVRNLKAHLNRLRLSGEELADIRDQLRAVGPGCYFPLITVSGGFYEVEIRPDRPFTSTVTVDATGIRDERRRPTVKGPDLGWLELAMATTRRKGADEGFILDERGRVIECIYSAPMLFVENKVIVSNHPKSLDSTTEAQLTPHLEARGYNVERRLAGFSRYELREGDFWVLNAFSGARRVSGWMEYGTALPVAQMGFAPEIDEANAWLWEEADAV